MARGSNGRSNKEAKKPKKDKSKDKAKIMESTRDAVTIAGKKMN